MEELAPHLSAYVADRELELTAFAAFPPVHWRRIWSTNPIKSPSRALGGVQALPDGAAIAGQGAPGPIAAKCVPNHDLGPIPAKTDLPCGP